MKLTRLFFICLRAKERDVSLPIWTSSTRPKPPTPSVVMTRRSLSCTCANPSWILNPIQTNKKSNIFFNYSKQMAENGWEMAGKWRHGRISGSATSWLTFLMGKAGDLEQSGCMTVYRVLQPIDWLFLWEKPTIWENMLLKPIYFLSTLLPTESIGFVLNV